VTISTAFSNRYGCLLQWHSSCDSVNAGGRVAVSQVFLRQGDDNACLLN
jgi:hypothetical protein